MENSKHFLQYTYFVVIGSRSGYRNLARLYANVLISDIIVLKGEQLSTNYFRTLQRP